MTKRQKLFLKLLHGSRNIAFADLVNIVEGFGFELIRISGSHHIFQHPNLPDQLNLQNKKGQAKYYQIRQFLTLIETYNLTLKDNGEDQS